MMFFRLRHISLLLKADFLVVEAVRLTSQKTYIFPCRNYFFPLEEMLVVVVKESFMLLLIKLNFLLKEPVS